MENNRLQYVLSLTDKDFTKLMKSASDSTKKLDGGMNKLNSTLSRVGGGIAAVFAVDKIVDFGKAVIDSLKNYEYFSASLRTLLYGDKNAAAALQGQLIQLAKTTPFSLVDVQEGSKQLLAYGFSAGKVTKDLAMLGDIASGVGQPLTEIVYLYGTLKTQGRAYTKDIMQFTGRGIPIIGQLAKQFKTTESNVMKLVEAGKVGFPQIEKAFKDLTSSGGQFFNMMSEQSKTVGGQLSNLGDSWEQLKVNIGRSQTGIIAGTVSFLGQMVSALTDYFEKSNRLSENFVKGGAKKFAWWETALHETVGVLTGYTMGYSPLVKQERFQQDMSVYSKPNNLQEAFSNKANLYRHSIGIDEKLKRGEITKDEAKRFQATIQGTLGVVNGAITLLKSKGIKTIPTTETDAKNGGSLGSATEVNGARPQNVIINLDRLGDITLNVNNMQESKQAIKDEFNKMMLEVLNDANQIAKR